nr:YqcI/YcgG family protein [Anoxybacillus sp. EFIL]
MSIQASKISRILNHYEGDKTPKCGEDTCRVASEIAKLHVILVSISKSLKGNLFEEIERVLLKNLSRDKGRFGHSQDPTTSSSIQRFKKVAEKTNCIFSSRAKIWGSYNFVEDLSLEENLENNLKLLKRFNRVAPCEGLDGFVIEVYGKEYGDRLDNLSKTLRRVLTYLSDKDPAKIHCMNQNILRSDWRFSFGGQTFFVTTFAPCYPKKHPRYSHNPFSTFVLLQPEFSFDHNGIHAGNPKRELIKEKIRSKFRENGSEYNIDLVRQPLEVYKYVKPINIDDVPVRWWEEK